MKKLIAIVLVAVMLMAVLAACGGETTTTETPATTTTTTTTTETPGNTEDPGNGNTSGLPEGWEDYEPLYNEGIDIMFGPDPDWWAIGATSMTNGCGVNFESHHTAFGVGNWCMVISCEESMNDVYGTYLFPEVEVEDAEGNITMERKPNELFTFIVTIDGTDYTITQWLNAYGETSCPYVRMGLGDFKPHEEGVHTYQISLRVVNKNTGKIEFWANWGDTNMGRGGYTWDRGYKLGFVASTAHPIPSNVERLSVGNDLNALEASGTNPDGAYGSHESVVSAFDGDVKTKLWDKIGEGSRDGVSTNPQNVVTFKVNDKIQYTDLAGIAIIGGDDDAGNTGRFVTSFKLYGSNETDDYSLTDAWTEIGTFSDEGGVIENHLLRYWSIDSATNVCYNYYKIEIECQNGTDYQLSEILFFCEKDQWTIVE